MDNRYDPVKFSRNLIKGRIAETIFHQMLNDTEKFTVLAFGYENLLPELARRQYELQAKDTMEVIRRAPDFAIINNETHEVSLIEVKFMRYMRSDWVFKAASRMYESWKPSCLFIVTPNGFYFDKVESVVQKKGEISALTHPYIPQELQDRYIALVNEFIGQLREDASGEASWY